MLQACHRTEIPISGSFRVNSLGRCRGLAFHFRISSVVFTFGANVLPLVPLASHAAPFSHPIPCMYWESHPRYCILRRCVTHAHRFLPWSIQTPYTLWWKLRLWSPNFCVTSGHLRMFNPSLYHTSQPLKYQGFKCVPLLFLGQVFVWFGTKVIPHVELIQLLCHRCLPLYPSSFRPRFMEYCVNECETTVS